MDTEQLEAIAEILKLKKGGNRVKFFDLAAVAKRKIPEYVYEDEEVLETLPIFFRIASNSKPSDEELEKLIQLIKKR
jgi:hypothetical protein